MEILHTADLHLRADRPKTVDAFRTILDRATANGIDLVTIGGDVFDSPEDATHLKHEVRDLCSDNPFEVIAIPGNHDADILSRPFDLGTDLRVLREDPCEVADFGDIRVVGVPFQRDLSAELFGRLTELAAEAPRSVLLIHCTLDIGFEPGVAGDEREPRYFPVAPATLSRLDFDTILAGHFHGYDCRDLPGETTFVYPGSPISHSWGETGKRALALVDSATGAVERLALDTFYYDTYERTIAPDSQADVPVDIERWILARSEDHCEVRVKVSGFVDADEAEYADRLRAVTGDTEPRIDIDSVSHVLDHPLYRRVVERLEETSLEEYPQASEAGIREHVRDSLARMIDTGEVRR